MRTVFMIQVRFAPLTAAQDIAGEQREGGVPFTAECIGRAEEEEETPVSDDFTSTERYGHP